MNTHGDSTKAIQSAQDLMSRSRQPYSFNDCAAWKADTFRDGPNRFTHARASGVVVQGIVRHRNPHRHRAGVASGRSRPYSEILEEGNEPVRVAGGRGMESGTCGWDTLITDRDGDRSLHPLPFPLCSSAVPEITRVEGCEPSRMPNRRGPSVLSISLHRPQYQRQQYRHTQRSEGNAGVGHWCSPVLMRQAYIFCPDSYVKRHETIVSCP
jgi:hypothetical protein